jgi:DNA-binding NarL/FixJ family response regulator
VSANQVLVVVENDPDFRLLIRVELARDPRIEISGEAASSEEALRLLASSGPGLVILDHYLDDETRGLEAAALIKEAAPQARVLLMSSEDLAREAARQPAVDAFLRKTDIDRLLPLTQRLLGLEPLAD